MQTKPTYLSFYTSILMLFFLFTASAQEVGDFKTKLAGGDWTDPNNWLEWDGNTWQDNTTGNYPDQNFGGGTVYVETNSSTPITFSVVQNDNFNFDGNLVINSGALNVKIETNSNSDYIIENVENFTLNGGNFITTFGNNPTLIMNVSGDFTINDGQLVYEGGGSNSEIYIDCKSDVYINGGIVIDASDNNGQLNDSGLYLSGESEQRLRFTSNVSPIARERFFIEAGSTNKIIEEYAGDIEQFTVYGETTDRGGYTGLQNRLRDNSLIINNTSAAGVKLSTNRTLSDTLGLHQGILYKDNNQLNLQNNAIIERSGGEINSAPTFGENVNIIYSEHSDQISTSVEVPTSETVLNDLTITNSKGVKATSDLYVNGQLDLSVSNPSPDYGLLEMVQSYAGYAQTEYGTSGFENSTASFNTLDSFILYMGANATTTGEGDVTGKIKRETVAEDVFYTMGNENSRIRFNSPSGSAGLPETIMFEVSIGANGEHIDNQDAELFTFDNDGNPQIGNRQTVQRLYQVKYTAPSTLPGSTRFTLRMAYQDSDLEGLSEEELITWDHHLPYFDITPHEHGRTAQSQGDNWVELSNHSVLYLTQEDATVQNTGEGGTVTKYWMISPRETEVDYLWLGAVNDNWNMNSNWSSGTPPNEDGNVLIRQLAGNDNYPVLNDQSGYTSFAQDTTIVEGEVRMRTVEITDGASLSVAENTTPTITLYGGPNVGGGGINYTTWNNSGTFNAGNSEVVFNTNFNTAQNSTVAGSTTFNDITITTDSEVELQDDSETFIAGSIINNGLLDASSAQNLVAYVGSDQDVILPNAGSANYHSLGLFGSGGLNLPAAIQLNGDLIINHNPDNFNLTNTDFEFSGGDEQFIRSNDFTGFNFNQIEVNNSSRVTSDVEQVSVNTLTVDGGRFLVENSNKVTQNDTIISLNNGVIGGTGTFEFLGMQTIADGLYASNRSEGSIILDNPDGFDIPSSFRIDKNLDLIRGEVVLSENDEFTIGGNITNTEGNIDARLASIRFSGENIQTFEDGVFVDNEIARVSVIGNGGPSLQNELTITELLSPEAGEFASNGHLVLRSDENGTSQVGEVGSNADVSGIVEVQRFIPGRRAFRLMASSVNSSGTIRENWQENPSAWDDDPNPGYGTHITGVGEVGDAEDLDGQDGFDWQPSGNPSLFLYNQSTETFYPIPNTDPNMLEVGTPYRLMVRGSRSTDIRFNSSGGTNTTLRARGTLKTGLSVPNEINPAIEEDEFHLVANPYHAIVDLAEVVTEGLNLKPYAAVWDPTLGGNPGDEDFTRGAYTIVDFSKPLAEQSSNSDSEANQFMQPMQAVFLYNSGLETETTIQFQERHKSVNQDFTAVFSQPESEISLKLYDANSYADDNTSLDAIRIKFAENGINTLDEFDMYKPENPHENFTRMLGSELITIERRAMPEHEEILPLFVNQYKDEDYIIDFESVNFPENYKVYIKDDYLDETELISGENSLYYFSIDHNVNASKAYNRFSIVFIDETFSTTTEEVQEVSLFPNPVQEDYFYLQLNNWQTDNLQVEIFSLTGNKVHETNAAVTSNKLQISDVKLSSGMYIVKLTDDAGSSKQLKIIKK
ncbi:MAG: T9SS type A sorting domain-containing protein [Bacteroidota bacterium]